MLIRVLHSNTYRYDPPAKSVIQILHLTPRNHEGQFVNDWRIDVSADCRLEHHEDAFGNWTHAFTADGPLDRLDVQVEGDVETRDTQGIIRGAVERFPPSLFLRETGLTRPDQAIAGFAAGAKEESSGETLELLHLLLQRLHEKIGHESTATYAATTAAEAFAGGRGASQDLAHVFISAARSLDIPARYIGGYFRCSDGVIAQQSAHAWAEAFVPRLGWVAFDVAHGICATDAHVRVAVGLDYLNAAPVRGTCYGGAGETLTVNIQVEQAGGQSQS